MRLIIVHNHFRPGGVRRVIELATPCLCRRWKPAVQEVILATGEMPEDHWLRALRTALRPVRLTCRIEPSMAYFAEQDEETPRLVGRLREFLDGLLAEHGGEQCLVWAHNQGLGRNLLLTHELQKACGKSGTRLVLHHHDWWFDNRWDRWPEMRNSGFRSPREVAEVVIANAPFVRHAAINGADASILERHLGRQACCLPNPAGPGRPVARSAARKARQWLQEQLGENAPVWLMPCRVLRRKNLAEGLLLARWLRPGSWLVVTAGVSSADEQNYAARLNQAAASNNWKFRMSILARGDRAQPSVPALMAASEAVLLTSLQEGFGLAYIEAAVSARPLICRALPNIMPDLARFGFRFANAYDEIRVHPSLFDWPAEAARQRRLFGRWRRTMPASCRAFVEAAYLAGKSAKPAPVPFSRLTLTAQLEVLAAPVERSWDLCAPLNPFLPDWRTLSLTKSLKPAAWPAQAGRRLGCEAYARTLQRLATRKLNAPAQDDAPFNAQQEFFRQRLASDNLYPLTWSPNS